jgi:hypothetical protein
MLHVASGNMINVKNGKVYDRPMHTSGRFLTPAQLADYVKAYQPLKVDMFNYRILLDSVAPGNRDVVWFERIDLNLPDNHVPVHPHLNRLTTIIRHRLAVRHARETFLFPELAMATHWRAGEASPFRQLNPDLFKHILDLAA